MNKKPIINNIECYKQNPSHKYVAYWTKIKIRTENNFPGECLSEEEVIEKRNIAMLKDIRKWHIKNKVDLNNKALSHLFLRYNISYPQF